MKEIEILEKRGKREKHFLQKNGEIIAKMYSDDIHFKNNGVYKEIDNTLIENDEYYVNKANDFKVYFSKDITKFLLKFERNKDYLEFFLKDVNEVEPTKTEDNSKYQTNIKYENILKNVDFEYIVCPTKLKENIILKSIDYSNISYIIKTNLDLKINNNIIEALKDNKVVFTIAKPYMVDSNNILNNNISYSLVKKDSEYELNIVLDEEWMKSDIKYPVTIDPTITNNSQNGNSYDTYIYPNDTNVDRNADPYLLVGVSKNNNVDTTNRALLKFDLPTIGTGSQIVSAFLYLVGYPVLNGSNETDIVNVHRITQDWTESNANWNTMNDKYDSKVESSFDSYRSIGDSSGNITPIICGGDITRLVKKWYSGVANYGVMLKENTEAYRSDIIPAFFSNNNVVSGNNPKPYIAISYRNQTGLENYWNYQSQSFSIGKTYLNTYNGNLVGLFDINKTVGGKLPANLSLVYNSNDVTLGTNIGLGLGYRFNLNQTIKEVTIESISYLEYIDSDGTVHYFISDGTEYKDEDGLNLTITRGDAYYTLIDKESNQMKFDIVNGIGYLTEISDTNSNKITITYDSNNKITKVTDANSQEINITYDTNIITVSSDSEITALNFLNGQLISIVDYNGTTEFAYNSNSLIETITDTNGLKIKYEYYDLPYRLKKISEYGLNDTIGQYFTIEYGYSSTTIVDNKNRSTILTFNDYGNIACSSDLKNVNDLRNAYGYIETYGEETITNSGTDTTYKNKLLSSGIPVKYVKNYLTDASFENNTIDFTGRNSTISISEDYYNYGLKSLKVENTAADEIVKSISNIEKGSSYTFSAYLKCDKSIRMGLSYIDDLSNQVNSIITIPVSDEFTRYDVTIDYPTTATSDLTLTIYLDEISTVYIDDMQFEVGEVANKYNMIENSDFSNGFADWTVEGRLNGTDTTIDTSNIFEVVSINDNNDKALKIKMNPANSTSISKTFNVKGKMGEKYNISFWYKDEGFYASGKVGDPICNNVVIQYNYTDSFNDTGHCILTSRVFNPNDSDWQYYSINFQAEYDFDSVTLTFYQEKNANNMYITNLYLYKDALEMTYSYDKYGNVISIFGMNSESSTFKYDGNNQLIKSTNPRGKHFTYEYDNTVTDRVLSGVSEGGVCNQIKYDANENPITTRTINSIVEELTETDFYNIRLKGTENYLRKSNNEIVISSDSNHDLWKLEKENSYYKIKHSILDNLYLNVKNSKLVLDTTYTLFEITKQDNNSFMINQKYVEETGGISKTEALIYLKEENGDLSFEKYAYDDYHYQFYFEIPHGKFLEQNSTYTDDDRFIKKIVDTNFAQTYYDIDETTGLTNSVTNPKGNVTNYIYDNKRRLSSVTNYDKKINYIYNSNNTLSKIRENNREYNFIYDEFLNSKEVKIGDNITLINNEYEENNGNLLKSTYGNGDSVSYTYDEFDRVKSITKMDDKYKYYYDNNGNIVKILSNNDIYRFNYDISKRLNEYYNNDFKIKYTYDKNSNITNEECILDNIHYTISGEFDEDDCVSKTTFDGNNVNYNYDYLDRLVNKNINNSYNTNYEFMDNGNRASLLVKSVDINNDKYSYKYDKLNNITHIYHNGILENKYYYDKYNELIEEDNYLHSKKIKYKYDIYGNLLYKRELDINNYDVINYNKYEYGNPEWVDQLTKFNDDIITYDEIGNPVTIGSKILTWTNGRQLITYTDTNNSISYKYNINGIRTSKIVNNIETKFYLENDNIILEKRGSNVLYYIRDTIDGLIGFKYNDDIYYYKVNEQGDILGIMDSDYNIVANYEYDSFGNILYITDENGSDVSNDLTHIANINPFRYRGYYYDSETKLYYLNSRYYNPEWGRFLNLDDRVGTNGDLISYNLYAYCGNNFVMGIDLSGKGFLKKLSKAITKTVTTVKKAIKRITKIINSAISVIKSVSSKVVRINMNTSVNKVEGMTGSKYIASRTQTSTTSVSKKVFGDDDALFNIDINLDSNSSWKNSIKYSLKGKNVSVSSEIGLGSSMLSVGYFNGDYTVGLTGGNNGFNISLGAFYELENNDGSYNYTDSYNFNSLIIVAVVLLSTGVGEISVPAFGLAASL